MSSDITPLLVQGAELLARSPVGKRASEAISHYIGVRIEKLAVKHEAETAAARAITRLMEQTAELPIEYVQQVVDSEYRRILRKNQNRANIAGKAITILTADDNPNAQGPEHVDLDWLDRFGAESELVSDEEIQNLFASILAGEIERPGSYSKRTVRILGDLERSTALIFLKVVNSTIQDRIPNEDGTDGVITNAQFFFNGQNYWADHAASTDITYEHIVALQEAGLLHSELSVTREIMTNFDGHAPTLIWYAGRYWVTTPSTESSKVRHFLCKGPMLTATGIELARMASTSENAAYTTYLTQELLKLGVVMKEVDLKVSENGDLSLQYSQPNE